MYLNVFENHLVFKLPFVTDLSTSMFSLLVLHFTFLLS